MEIDSGSLFALFPGALSGCETAPCALIECGGSRPAASEPHPTRVTLHLDYGGAEAILRALEQDSLSDVEVDALLRVHGARAMVDNVTRFIPRLGFQTRLLFLNRFHRC